MKNISCFLPLTLFLFVWSNTLLAQQKKTLLNKIHVKVNDSLALSLNRAGHQTLQTGFTTFDHLNQQWGVKNIKRVFPDAGKFEAAHRNYGLHQWYEVAFEDSVDHDINQLIQIYQQNEAVIVAEAVYQMSIDVLPQQGAAVTDPELEDQWHYENTGQSGGTKGADIKLNNAWKLETGSKEVVVAIIDGGMDPTHEDLKDAMWVNQAEADGKKDVDDDHNGYVDDIYGYGFGDIRGDFYPHYHGVHVGGTVGAVSMNGTGVAGIAGGSGTGDGVRLMSCAVFGSYSQGGFPEAFIYAADNGAVIAQNSWGGGAKSDVLEDAIDYFIARAGYDNTEENYDKNIQIGPMAGGIVIFAAGNSSSSHKAYPGSYEPCVAVASTDHNDRKSGFSNYGDWVDISAPGSNVLSSYLNNTYNYLSGTSMACPHVSGTAALIVSRFGQKGFKPDQVKSLLFGSADNIDDLNTGYEGELGAGRLNAFRALNFDDNEKVPAAITDMKVDSVTHRSAILSWTATGNDGNEGAAAVYDLRYATAPITNENFSQATPINNTPIPKLAGEKEQFEARDLPSNTKLYFAIKALDYHQLASGLSNIAQTQTKAPPVMKVSPESFSVSLNSGDSLTRQLTIDNTQGKSPLEFSLAVQENTDSDKTAHGLAKNNSDKKVLLIRYYKSYSKDAEDLLKESFDITPDIINHYAVADHDFSTYDLIIIASAQSNSFYHEISAQKAKFESFASRGGVVLYQAHGYRIDLPGDVSTDDSYSYTDLKILDHPITKDIADKISANYSSKYYLQQLPANNKILTVTQSDSLPSTAVYEYEAGEIIATTMPWEYFYYYQHEASAFLHNAIYYALNESKPHRWLKPYTASGTVAAGSSVKLNVHFNADRMFGGIYQKDIVIMSNDPKNERVIVPVTMEVTGAPVIQVSVKEMDFGSLYTKQSRTDTLIISNQGTDTLKISDIAADLTAYTADTKTLQLGPFEEQKVAVTFSPLETGTHDGKLMISSNDKKNGTLEISLRGTALLPPIAEVTPESITLTLKRGQQKTSTLTISNEKGGSDLNWKMKMNYSQYEPIGSDALQADFSMTAEGETHRKPTPFQQGKMLVYDPEHQSIFSTGSYQSKFYKFHIEKNRWEEMQDIPNTNGSVNDGTYLKGKIYMVIPTQDRNIVIYDIKTNTWSTSTVSTDNSSPYLVTADDEYLYIIFKDNSFRKYDINLNEKKKLTSIRYYNLQNLLYFNGNIYAHDANNLYAYNIAGNAWSTLENPPYSLNSTSAIDPLDHTLYFSKGYNWFMYDIDEKKWYITYNGLTNSSYDHTYLTYVGDEERSGVYFLNGTTFGQYETKPYHQWLSFSDKEGSISKANSQQIALTINADNLLPGSYGGSLMISTNDPATPQLKVPVKLTVIRDDDPAQSQPPVLTDSLKGQELILQEETYDINLARFFKDPEDYPLSFIVSSRNANVASTNVAGSVLSIATEDTGETVLDLLAEDIDGLTLSYSFKVTVTQHNDTEHTNLPPVTTLSQQQYNIAMDEQLSLYLDSLFSDPNGDALVFQATVSDTAAAKAEIFAEHILQIQPLTKGNFMVDIIASDSLGESIKVNLSVTAFAEALTLSDSLQNISLLAGDSSAIQLESLIANGRTEDMAYKVDITDSTILTTIIKNTVLSLYAQKAGTTDVTVIITSKWGDVVSATFTVEVAQGALGVENPEFLQYDLTSYPNPLGVSTVIAYELTEKTHARLQVYTTDGTLLTTLMDEEQTAGIKHLQWDTRYLPAGMYIICLITSQGMEMMKVVK